MSQTSLYQTLGAMRFPTTVEDAADATLAGLDPARDVLLGLFESAINDELGAAWSQITAVVPQFRDRLPVADKWPGTPTPDVVQQRKGDFPCLFLARSGPAQIDELTIWREKLTQEWGLHYILPPLEVADQRRIDAVLIRVAAIVGLTIRNLRHKSYESGAFILPAAGLSSMRIKSLQAGQARFAEDPNSPLYNAMSAVLETTELSGFVDGTESELQGAHLTLGTGQADGIIPNIVEGDTDPVYQP